MNKEELYKLALSDVHKYNLLNEIFAIRDTREEKVDYTIGVNGFISLDVLNQYVEKIQRIDKAIEFIENFDIQFDVKDDWDTGAYLDTSNILSILKGENNE